MNNFLFVTLIVITVVLGIGGVAFSISHCGLGKTLLLGKGAFPAAAMGMCD